MKSKPHCIMSVRCKGEPDHGLMCPKHRAEDERIYDGAYCTSRQAGLKSGSQERSCRSAQLTALSDKAASL